MRLLTILAFAASALLLAYGSWVIWTSVEFHYWSGVAYGVVPVVAGVAAFARQPWSRWVAVVTVVLLAASWLYALWKSYEIGVFPLETPLTSVLSLVPGLGMIGVAAGCAYALFAYFSRRAKAA
jgi:hypothetical protein